MNVGTVTGDIMGKQLGLKTFPTTEGTKDWKLLVSETILLVLSRRFIPIYSFSFYEHKDTFVTLLFITDLRVILKMDNLLTYLPTCSLPYSLFLFFIHLFPYWIIVRYFWNLCQMEGQFVNIGLCYLSNDITI